jgi:murein DD-endopeptidase MepM/ murein hydrolase activator NlpD
MSRTRVSRRIVAAVAVACLLAVASPSPAGADEQLRHARHELRQTKARIRARTAALRDLQHDLNRLATRISNNESLIARTEERMGVLRRDIRPLAARYRRLRAQLDERSRTAYILGPGAPILYLITATSAADVVERVSLLGEMNRRDALLAREVVEAQTELALRREKLERYSYERRAAVRRLHADQEALKRKLARSKRLLHQLRGHEEQVLYAISRIRPFAVCPVRGPHAVADDFGIWVHHTKAEGGDHIHQGNDITAPYGTPIVAPFDGRAVATPNRIGGLAVKVFGKYGYVYNAHLSRYGRLGEVTKGTIIGYVGATGNAGGPHDHFEWHPGNGPAVDPYPFLVRVC